MMVKDAALETIDCGIFVTRDRGRTWRGQTVGMSVCADPWLALFPDGRAAFTLLSKSGESPELLLLRSMDGGDTRAPEPVRFGAVHDHPKLVVDTSKSQYRGSLYVVSGRGRRNASSRTRYTVFSARSPDGGDPSRTSTTSPPAI